MARRGCGLGVAPSFEPMARPGHEQSPHLISSHLDVPLAPRPLAHLTLVRFIPLCGVRGAANNGPGRTERE
jgi:hypothetical protein